MKARVRFKIGEGNIETLENISKRMWELLKKKQPI